MEDIYIATNKNYKDLVRSQLPGIPEENILCEPVGRNTAPCIGLGAAHIGKKYENALMLVLPSDQDVYKRQAIVCRRFKSDDYVVRFDGIESGYQHMEAISVIRELKRFHEYFAIGRNS